MQEPNNPSPDELGDDLIRKDAKVTAIFYRELRSAGIPETIAKDLTIAYIVKPPLDGR